MKPVRYTRHAKNRMRWRRISEAEVESALLVPDFVGPSSGMQLHAWKALPEKYLRVTYIETDDEVVVLSAVKKKTGWR